MDKNEHNCESRRIDKVYLLCDCNNFFASCEKLFRPDLKTRPVAVLSNNDGIVVSRSYETKSLGIPMGSPVFKIQKEINKYKIATFSSNFSLYLDISNRVMSTLESFCNDIEIYSVDEAFLIFHNITKEEALNLAFRAKNAVATLVGIQIGVGVAKTKTLAKLANHHAKQHRNETHGVFSVLEDAQRQRILLENPIGEIWGIGKKNEEHLTEDGYRTALDLSKADPDLMQKRYSIVLSRTIKELNDIDCIASVISDDVQGQILWSRTFKERITDFDDLLEAISNYVADASSKLRQIDRYAKKITIFIRTSFFGNKPKYANDATLSLDYPCRDTRVFLEVAKELLKVIYKKDFEYMKAGVVLYDLVEERTFQADLFSKAPEESELIKSDLLMDTIDLINSQTKNSIYFGAQNKLTKERKFNGPDHLSPRYTSSFDELPKVY
ncbi:MAG: Y-family DNA polymerase [Succinivibrio sp.]|nr:Y-family DNA polymerase [Succinivibrio sp.]